MIKGRFLGLLFGLGLLFQGVSDLIACPKKEEVHPLMQKLITVKDFEIIDVQQVEDSNLCEIAINLSNTKQVLYIDKNLKHFVIGDVIRTSDLKNLTLVRNKELNKITKDDLNKLEKLVAFVLSKSDKAPKVYFITDPNCSFCKKVEGEIYSLYESGDVQVGVILYPILVNKGSKEESISIICDKKGLEGLRTNYKSNNQCKEGVNKIEETLNFLSSKGIIATPAFVFPNGTIHTGYVNKDQLKQMIIENK